MPILAKAVFKFEGAQSDDLSFDEDDVITIIQKDDSGWRTGRTDDGRQGDFPFNYGESSFSIVLRCWGILGLVSGSVPRTSLSLPGIFAFLLGCVVGGCFSQGARTFWVPLCVRGCVFGRCFGKSGVRGCLSLAL